MGRRLHPSAVGAAAFDSLRQAALPVLALAVVGGGLDRFFLYGLGASVLSVVMAWVSWQTTRWGFEEGTVRMRRGLLSEHVTTIPFDRVQAIDTVRGPVQRLFGVVELHVQAAGGGRAGEIVLKAVTPADAEELRETVRAGRGGPEAAPAEAEPDAVWRLGRRDLVVAALTSGSLGVLIPVVAGASQALDELMGAERAEGLVPESWAGLALVAGGVVALAFVLSFLGTIVAFAGFTAVRDGERIRIGRGIVERREASVPVARIHAVRVVESPLREPFGLAQVRIESAGYAAEPATAQTLVPLVRRRDVPGVLAQLLPELAVGEGFPGALAPPPRRALRRFVAPPLAAGVVAAAAPVALLGAAGLLALVLPALGAALGVARFRAAGWRLDGDRLVLRARRLTRTTAIADPHRLQHVGAAQSALQRRAALGDLVVAVSSGRRLGVAHLDWPVVGDLLGRLAAAAVGKRDGPRFGASPAG